MSDLSMYRLFLSDRSLGDGFRTVLINDADLARDSLTAFVPSLCATTKINRASLEKAKKIDYRPLVVRRNILARVAMHRKYGFNVPSKTVQEVLAKLGAGATTIRTTLNTEPEADVVAARERAKERAERRAEEEAAKKAIAARVDMAPEFEAIERSAAQIETKERRMTNLEQLLAKLENGGATKDEIMATMNWTGGCSKRIVKVAKDAGRELVKEPAGRRILYRFAPAC